MLSNALVFANGKGGVGKTSMAANVAGLAAVSGWPTLLVDLDPQGNIGSDLGYWRTDRDDQGQGLLKAVVGDDVPDAIQVRDHLHVIAGGSFTEELGAVLQARIRTEPKSLADVRDAIARHVADSPIQYSLIVIDTPPATSILVDAAMTAAHYVVVPTKGDAGSLNGLQVTADKFARIRTDMNADLAVLGVALFGFGAGDKRLVAEAREQLERDLADVDIPVFDAFIRDSRKSGTDMRRLGQLAHEYEKSALEAEPFWKNLRRGRSERTDSYSQASGGLADDYQRLTTEILSAFTAGMA